MEFVQKITKRMSIYIPRDVREKMDVKVGDLLVVMVDERENVIKISKLDNVVSTSNKKKSEREKEWYLA